MSPPRVDPNQQLARRLGLFDATMIVMGGIIGSGIFLNPSVVAKQVSTPFLILGALLLESFFSIPGLGAMTLNAIHSSDFPVIKAMTILSAVAYIIFSVLTDVCYTLVDPRVRLG
jgi:peptide/nickel transport system permease protein